MASHTLESECVPQSPVELVTEILGSLREEVKEMQKTNWIFEGDASDDNAHMRIKV